MHQFKKLWIIDAFIKFYQKILSIIIKGKQSLKQSLFIGRKDNDNYDCNGMNHLWSILPLFLHLVNNPMT